MLGREKHAPGAKDQCEHGAGSILGKLLNCYCSCIRTNRLPQRSNPLLGPHVPNLNTTMATLSATSTELPNAACQGWACLGKHHLLQA